jgi:uncharacterized protein involved in outer membrane biogenesis
LNDEYIYDASLVSEDIWLDYWKLNGGAYITIERPNPTGGNPALMQPPQQNPTAIKGVKALVFEIDIEDVRSSAGRLRVGDKKFETLEQVHYGDLITHESATYEVFRVDPIDIGEMRVYSTKAHKVG